MKNLRTSGLPSFPKPFNLIERGFANKTLVIYTIFVFSISLYPQQWEFANGPYEATLFNISIDPVNPNIIYTVGEGVLRSTNSGAYWTEIEPDTILRSNLEPVIKADPQNSGVVYYGGHGALFKSYNFGENWEVIGFENRSVTSIEIDPVNSDIIYVGLKNSSDDAIWKSMDAGETWVKKTDGIPINQSPIQKCKAIKINPLNNKSLIVAISFEGIFKSLNEGNNWECIFENINPLNDIEVFPWDTTTIFCADWSGVYKTTNNGLTWTQIFIGWTESIEIDKITREIYIGTNGDGIYQSSDEGNTWIQLNNAELPNSFSLAMNVYDIRIDLSVYNTLYIATGAGIYKSFNKGKSWIQSFNGLNGFFSFCIAVSQSNHSIIYAAGREGIHKSTNGGESWKYIGGNSSENFIAIDPTNYDIVYVAHIPIYIDYWLWRTTNGGKTWKLILTGPIRFPFIELDPDNSSTLFTANYEENLYKSSDRGDTWDLISTPVAPTSMLISKKNNLVIYIGSPNGVYKTTNGGIIWTYLGLSENNSNAILSYAPQDENIIYASFYGKGVFKTTDGGLNWEEKNNGLTSKNISVFISNPKKFNQYYIGTIDSGIYISNDGGNEWSKLFPEHPSLLIDAIFLDTTGTGRIFAAGRNAPGIYILDLDLTNVENPEPEKFPGNFILYQNYPNPFNSNTIIKFILPSGGNIKLEVYDLLGRRIITLIDEYKNRGEYSIEWNGKNEKGEYISSGLYFFRLLNANMVLSKKMIVIK